MKITKARLLQIIREEVELHQEKLEENTFVFEEEDLQAAITDKPLPTDEEGDISNKNAKDVLDDASQGKMEEIEKVKHKGKIYKATSATMKAIRGGGSGPGKVTPAEFEKAVKQASWADNPEAVAAAGRIVAKKKAGTMEESDVEEDKLFDPNTKQPLKDNKKEKLEIKIK